MVDHSNSGATGRWIARRQRLHGLLLEASLPELKTLSMQALPALAITQANAPCRRSTIMLLWSQGFARLLVLVRALRYLRRTPWPSDLHTCHLRHIMLFNSRVSRHPHILTASISLGSISLQHRASYLTPFAVMSRIIYLEACPAGFDRQMR